jgi:hypothetical protein
MEPSGVGSYQDGRIRATAAGPDTDLPNQAKQEG